MGKPGAGVCDRALPRVEIARWVLPRLEVSATIISVADTDAMSATASLMCTLIDGLWRSARVNDDKTFTPAGVRCT
tara:strand:- start:93 stop:320 length:228 start_codon:yes stop_codon:yes gene_type:complete